MRFDSFPRFPLIHAPTPLEPLNRLRKYLQGPRLYIKRDDCTGLAFGGNKSRKLEYLIGEALQMGATTIVSEGGLQSNHVRQTAAAAAKSGLKCHLVLHLAVPIDSEVYLTNGNFLLDRLLGAVVHVCASGENRPTRIDSLLLDLRSKGEVPYFIPTGGSNATGALGYAAMMSELLNQAIDLDISVDHVVLACGSGGTQAGLTVGRMLNQDSPKIIGIDIDGETEELAHHTYLTATVCARKLGLHSEIDQGCIELVAGHAAPGYGLPNVRMIEAVKLTAQLEGIFLDPVYTGKAMAGLFDMVQKGRFEKHETVIFMHTGGTPGLFAYADIF